MPIVPVPGACSACGGGGGAGAAGIHDVEDNLLCETTPDGTVVGTALAIQDFDNTTGLPIGVPTFIDPVTGAPYVVGAGNTLQPCPSAAGCGAPVRFCFVSSATTDEPGRMYDLTFTQGIGFAVTGIIKDLTVSPFNVLWDINDTDGTQFAADLQSTIQTQFPGATVTVTGVGTDPCGGTGDFTIHIECLLLSATPPSLVQLQRNNGRDLIQNPAFLTTPPQPPNPGLSFVDRTDTPVGFANADVNCTAVANRGWETNDKSQVFELWGPIPSFQNSVENTTPTPRGTAVQEINAFGSGPTPVAGANAGNAAFGQNPDTLWQTFVVPAAGNFTVRVVVGGRAGVENIPIKLSTGDVGDAGIGDIINTSVNAARVTNNSDGGPGPYNQPWTTFTQTVPLAAGTYTLAFTGPTQNSGPGTDNAFGGLFTDMRVFSDAPGTIANFVNDDVTCTIPVTASTTTCAFFAPQCSNGTITGWYNVATGEVFTNAAFWAQVPAPQCCETVPSADGSGGATLSNLVHTYLVCGQTDTGQRTLSRVVYTDPNGGAISEQFVDTSGALVTPSSWQPGQCPDAGAAAIFAGFVCDVSDVVPATPASCPGAPLAASEPTATNDTNVAAGPIYESNGGASSLEYNDEEICSLELTLTGDTGLSVPEYGFLISWAQQSDSTSHGLSGGGDGDSAGQMAAAMGLAPGDPAPPGSTGTIVVADTTVTLTIVGPGTPHIRPGSGDTLSRNPGDGDTQPITVHLDFSPPVHQVVVTYGTPGNDDTGTGRGLTNSQVALATPAVLASGGPVQVKQFRNADGTSFYENLDGTPHAVVGVIGACETIIEQEILCDFGAADPITGIFSATQFARTFVRNGAGALLAQYDTDLVSGGTYIPAGTVGNCLNIDSELVVLCDLGNLDGPGGTPHTFFRQYMYDVNSGSRYSQNAYDITGGNLYGVIGPVAPYPCAATAVDNGRDIEDQLLCDDNGPFIRSFQYNADSGLPSGVPSDFTLTGAPYVTVGTVLVCGAATGTPTVLGNLCRGGGPAPLPTTVILEADGVTVTYRDTATGAVVVAPVFIVCREAFVTQEILCDAGAANAQFIRIYTNVNGTVGVGDRLLDGVTPYAFVGPAVLCPQAVTVLAENDVELQVLCDSNGTAFLRRYVYDSETPGAPTVTNTTLDGVTAFVPVGAVGVCTQALYDSRTAVSFILCSSTPVAGTQFIRTYLRDGETGAFTGINDVTLAGAPFAPGVVSVCSTTVTPDTDFLSQVLCDTVGSFLQLQRYNSQTGVLVSTTNLTLTGAAYVPVGAIGACSNCCPVVLSTGCSNVGSLTYTSLRLANGTISLIDSVTGAAITAVNVVACAPANGALPATVAADHFDVVPGAPWTPAAIPAGRRLVGLSYAVIAGTVTTVDANGATAIAAIPAGYSANWNVQDDRETLTPVASITAAAASRAIVTMLTAL